jgi:hypothetical protein
MTIRALATFILTLGATALPAFATIQFSYCTSGCSSTTGNYAAWQTGTGSAGLTFSMAPITFAASGLVGGVYTDTSGSVFTGYNGASANALIVSGTSLAQTVSGSGTGIEIVLPANTFAIAVMINVVSGFGLPSIAVNNRNLNAANYSMTIPNSSSPQFFGILSDTALTSIFIGNPGAGGAVKLDSFELGEAAQAPEASTLALIGGGLVLVGFLRRIRIHKPDRPLA